MVLTSHRLDCFKLAMDLLLCGGSLGRFDRVVLLLNGVKGAHLRYIHQLLEAYPELPWDIISGPRGRGTRISGLQNECVRRYPGALYFKIDEDTFVYHDWVDKLTHAYKRFQADPRLSLITPVIPNNAAGFYYLLTTFSELAAEYGERFSYPIDHDCSGTVWAYPQVAEWVSYRFLDLAAANRKLESATSRGSEPFTTFAYRFSINCIVYDYRHWEEIGGVPDQDEIGWGDWIPAHGKRIVLVTNALAHHYSFFNQQGWLDRRPLLEDIRRVNLPERMGPLGYRLPRWHRIARQVPDALARRVGVG